MKACNDIHNPGHKLLLTDEGELLRFFPDGRIRESWVNQLPDFQKFIEDNILPEKEAWELYRQYKLRYVPFNPAETQTNSQFVGLNDRGADLVKDMQKAVDKVERTYPNGDVDTFIREAFINRTKTEEIGTCGMFDEIPLRRYKLSNGKEYTEFVQFEYWSSGPVIYTALKDEQGDIVEESLWDEAVMEEECVSKLKIS